MSSIMKKEAQQNLQKLENQMRFDLSSFTNSKESQTSSAIDKKASISSTSFILSPEEDKDRKQTEAIDNMKISMNLDEFYDVVFQIESKDGKKSYIKGNSHILKGRSEYFRAMFN